MRALGSLTLCALGGLGALVPACASAGTGAEAAPSTPIAAPQAQVDGAQDGDDCFDLFGAPVTFNDQPSTAPIELDRGEDDEDGSAGEFFAAPIPFRDSQIGWGLALIGGYIFSLDEGTQTPPSTVAAGGFYSENDSFGAFGMGRGSTTLPPELRPEAFDALNTALGLHGERDTRDNAFYPSGGTWLWVEADFFAEALGGEFDYQSYLVDMAGYPSLNEETVLAWRVRGQDMSNAPFYASIHYFSAGEAF